MLKTFDHEVIRKVPVTAEALREVRAGMDKVTSAGGTAYGLAVEGVPFGGKTGTAETEGGHGANTTWFVAYAPSNHPKIALAVFMEKSGGYGASVAGPSPSTSSRSTSARAPADRPQHGGPGEALTRRRAT